MTDDENLKPCPVCGATPRVITAFSGRYYVLCIGHRETVTRPTAASAIELWNAGQYEPERKPLGH